MRFSVEPFAGDSGFTQWHDAMKMCARLPGGIPPEFRRRMWLTLAEQHVRRRGIVWKDAERNCFNEWASPDDEGLGDQIIKDLHRTGCSLFCGADAEVNQALLKRVLLGYARWNKSVGYCQGFNMLAAIILEVMDKQESDALKVMIYLIEGVLPESYFANNLRGLSVDMAVFRELMRIHLPELSRHLEMLQHEAADQATGACYEPPLTNVFTMQWFLTLFSNCLPREAVMRVWDLTFLQGNEMLLRTALAIWGRLSSRILEVPSADEFYSVMGDLTREMLIHGLMDANQLVQTLIAMAPFPFPGLGLLRDKYTYNITPWTQSVSSVARKGLKIFYLDEDEEEEKADHDDVHQKMAIATAFGLAGFFRKSSDPRSSQDLSVTQGNQDGRSSPGQTSSMTRPNLDISALKKQYTKLRERQRQAHIILTASNIRRKSIDEVNKFQSFQKTNQLTMKHLLRGKKALTTRTKRVVAQGVIPPLITKKKVERKLSDSTGMKKQNGSEDKSPKTSHKLNSSKPAKQTLKSKPLSESSAGVEVTKKKSLQESDTSESPKSPLKPSETLHWKDTPKRARRASLPYGVKLMEAPPAASPLPDIKDDDDGCSSSSTELCDDDEDDLAVLSEEELPVASVIQRPVSTSPRLENRKEDTEAVGTVGPVPLSVKEESQINSIRKIDRDILPDAPPNQPLHESIEKAMPEGNLVPNQLHIPTISEPFLDKEVLPIGRASLSSPTKWKWSFSEIENPDLIQPVSPILKLHNFLSDESLEIEDSEFLSTSPKITLNTECSTSQDLQTEQERSDIFAYLFEITDVTKLSNANSEEPSPIEDFKKEATLCSEDVKSNNLALTEDSYQTKDSDVQSNNVTKTLPPHSTEEQNLNILSEEELDAINFCLQTPVETKVPNDVYHVKSIDDKFVSDNLTKNEGKEETIVNNIDISVLSGRKVPQTYTSVLRVSPMIYEENIIDSESVGGEHIKNESETDMRPSSPSSNELDRMSCHLRDDKVYDQQVTEENFSEKQSFSEFQQGTVITSLFSEAERSGINEEVVDQKILIQTSPTSSFLSQETERHKIGVTALDNKTLIKISPIPSEMRETEKREIDETVVHQKPSLQTSSTLLLRQETKRKDDDEQILKNKLPTQTSSLELEKRIEEKLDYEVIDVKTESLHSSPEDVSSSSDYKVRNIDLKSYYFSDLFKSISIESESYDTRRRVNDSTHNEAEKGSEGGLEPSDDTASEVIRRKLWAGVKSLSLDAELLIATNKTQKCYLDFSASSLPTLDESPSTENVDEMKKDSVMYKPSNEIGPKSLKKMNKRRNSEAALQLMKENTKIIDQILNQRYVEGKDNIFLVNKKEMDKFEGGDPFLFLKTKSLSDQSIAESLSSDMDDTRIENWWGSSARNTSPVGEGESYGETICDLEKNNYLFVASNVSATKPSEIKISSSSSLNELKENSYDKPIDSSISPVPFLTAKYSSFTWKPESASSTEDEKWKSEKNDDKITKKEQIEKDSNDMKCSPTSPIVPFSKLSKLSPRVKANTQKSILTERSVSFDVSTTSTSKEKSQTNSSSCQTSPLESTSKLECLMSKYPLEKSRPPHFNPFPTKPLNRPPKEAAVKLGLYSSSKLSGDSSS